MKRLLLLRHAKSSWDQSGLADHERPLAARGRRDAPRMGQLIAEEGLMPDVILCSTATRTRQTAQGLFEAWGQAVAIDYLRSLYHGDPEDYMEALQGLEAAHEVALLIGHNPGMEHTVELFSGGWQRMPTAALAHIELDIETWAEASAESQGRLVNLWRPKEL